MTIMVFLLVKNREVMTVTDMYKQVPTGRLASVSARVTIKSKWWTVGLSRGRPITSSDRTGTGQRHRENP
jgi:hypothetical protein